MEEIRTGKNKEFFFSVLWSILILFAGRIIITLLPAYKLIGGLGTVAMFSVLGFFVLTRYAAVFTYTLKGYNLRINRTIGKRNKEIEIKISEITDISHTKPMHMPSRQYVYTMCPSVFSEKKRFYVQYTRKNINEVLIFEPSEKTVQKIKELMNNQSKEFTDTNG